MMILLVHSCWYIVHVRSEITYARGQRYVSYMSQRLSKACVRVSVVLHLKPFLFQVYWLLCFFFDCTALGPTVILRALTCLDKGPETRGFSRVLGVVGIISILYTKVTVIN